MERRRSAKMSVEELLIVELRMRNARYREPKFTTDS